MPIMTNEIYLKELIKAFNDCKKIIKEGKRTPVIDTGKEKWTKLELPAFGDFPNLKIASISENEYSHSAYIHLAGVNVLFYLVCIYLRLDKNKVGKYRKYRTSDKTLKMKERVEFIKQNNFIFEQKTRGFWYYPISELKSTQPFIFDLTEMNGDTKSND